MKQPTIGVAVITHCAKHHLKSCLPQLLSSPLKPRVLVVNSSSNDGTVEESERFGAETLVIPRNEFNHGSTRELARKHLGTDIIVMITPDAYALDNTLIESLTLPIRNGQASISYARQLPHKGAGFFEAFPRQFNYPEKSHIRGWSDRAQYGSYLFFCSDSCSAYLNSALDEIGGFPSVLIGEDFVVTAKLLKAGHKIAYVAEAQVRHSHHYGLTQEFRRHFDTGLARKEFKALIGEAGRDEKRGVQFLAALACRLLRRPWLIPYACLQTAFKWIGYQAGRRLQGGPAWIKRRLSSQDFYWISKDYLSKKGNLSITNK